MTAGVLEVKVEFAKDLKPADLFGKNDAFAKVKVGRHSQRTKTLKSAGTSPIWNETFTYKIVSESSLDILMYDADVMTDEYLGAAHISLKKVRAAMQDHVKAPVVIRKTNKQQGYVSVLLTFKPRGHSDLQVSCSDDDSAYSLGTFGSDPAPSPPSRLSGPGYVSGPPSGHSLPAYGSGPAPGTPVRQSGPGYVSGPPTVGHTLPTYGNYSQSGYAPPSYGNGQPSGYTLPPYGSGAPSYPPQASNGYPPHAHLQAAGVAHVAHSNYYAPPPHLAAPMGHPSHSPSQHPQALPGYQAPSLHPQAPAGYAPRTSMFPPPSVPQASMFHPPASLKPNGQVFQPGLPPSFLQSAFGVPLFAPPTSHYPTV